MANVANVVSVCESNAAMNTETLEWRINAWSSLPSEHAVGAATQGRTYSETMQAAGDKWQIEVMPGGWSRSTDTEAAVQHRKEHVAIFLYYKGDSEALRTKFSIIVVNQLPGKADGTVEAPVVTFGAVPKVACGDLTFTWNGFPEFFKRSNLEDESNGFKVNDRVVIRITVTTFGDLESTVAAPTPAFTPPNTTTADFKAMLDTGRASDIALYCGPREFPAHRFVLRARSPYFEGLFSSRGGHQGKS